MNANQVQQQILEEMLTQNADTEYLRGFLGSGDRFDRELFKKKVPIVNYEDIKPYIERIASGEPSHIILAQPISELLTSSGTSGGQPKLMPSNAADLDRKTFLYNLLVPVMNQKSNGTEEQMWLQQLYEQGARTFWIHNTGPIGCLPSSLFSIGTPKPEVLDQQGCLKSHNDMAVEFNNQFTDSNH